MSLSDFTPAGMVFSADEAARSAAAGNYGDASLNALGAVPGAAVTGAAVHAARAVKPLENLVSRSAYIYDPPVKSPRPFEADYPHGAVADEAGNLAFDIDGRPLSARHVVGRRSVSGPDVALPGEALDEIAAARTGQAIRSVAPGSQEIGRDVGRAAFRSGGQPDYVAVSRSLTADQGPRVAAHEIGHVIDKTAGEIPVAGLNDELRAVYNDLNNPQGYGKRFGPEQNRYRGGEVPRELMTEAIRAYMADPNYLKTVAPKTAARIREHVNANPRLKDIIQFNTVAPVAIPSIAGGSVMGAGGDAQAAAYDQDMISEMLLIQALAGDTSADDPVLRALQAGAQP
jgi:hypothetical protein